MTYYQQQQVPLVYQPNLGYATLPPPPTPHHYSGGAAGIPPQSAYPSNHPSRGQSSGCPVHAVPSHMAGAPNYMHHSVASDNLRRPQTSSGYYGQYAAPAENTHQWDAPRNIGLASAGYITPPTLKDWFHSVDTDGSNLIDAYELVNALRKGKINISVDGAAKLIALFDTNGIGQINFEQFKDMHPFIDSMTKGFKKRDLSGDGYLQINEVQAALIDSGHRVSTECLEMIMAKFDTERRGMLSFENYVTLSIFITSVKNTFALFDKSANGRVMMDFNQFLSACIMTK